MRQQPCAAPSARSGVCPLGWRRAVGQWYSPEGQRWQMRAGGAEQLSSEEPKGSLPCPPAAFSQTSLVGVTQRRSLGHRGAPLRGGGGRQPCAAAALVLGPAGLDALGSTDCPKPFSFAPPAVVLGQQGASSESRKGGCRWKFYTQEVSQRPWTEPFLWHLGLQTQGKAKNSCRVTRKCCRLCSPRSTDQSTRFPGWKMRGTKSIGKGKDKCW